MIGDNGCIGGGAEIIGRVRVGSQVIRTVLLAE